MDLLHEHYRRRGRKMTEQEVINYLQKLWLKDDTSVHEAIALEYVMKLLSREIDSKKPQKNTNTLVFLPCSFCGSPIEYHPKSHKINNMWNKYTVYCPKCDLTMEKESALELNKAWNTRAKHIETVDTLNSIKERINDNIEVTEPHVLDCKHYRNEGREEAIDIIDNYLDIILSKNK